MTVGYIRQVYGPSTPGPRYELVVNGKVIGSSKHRDYFEYHAARGDIKAIKDAGITSFIHQSQVELLIVECLHKNDKKTLLALQQKLIDEGFDMKVTDTHVIVSSDDVAVYTVNRQQAVYLV